LATDVESLAHTVSDYVKKSLGATTVALDLADAIEAAMNGGRIATLIVPHDAQIGEAGDGIPVRRDRATKTYLSSRVVQAAKALKSGKSALLLGGDALSEPSILLAGRIAAIGDADLLCDNFFARMERGGGLPSPAKLPYFPDEALELTRRYQRVIVAGTRRPVAFFGYPGLPSYLTTEEQTVILAGPQEDTLGALAALASAVNAPDVIDEVPCTPPVMPKGDLNRSVRSSQVCSRQNALLWTRCCPLVCPISMPRSTHLDLAT
jgi:acetolactate synthase-1/2/3 large subunit